MNENLKHIEKAIEEINKIKPANKEEESLKLEIRVPLYLYKERIRSDLRDMFPNTQPSDCNKCINRVRMAGREYGQIPKTEVFCKKDKDMTNSYCPSFDHIDNYEINNDEPPDDAICTREVKGKCKDCGHFKDINVPFCGMCSKHNKSAGNDETCDDFKLSDKEFDEIADAMEQVGKNIEKEKQLNDKEIEKLEEQFASDEYIEELRQKQQTDCSKCIYQISKLGNLPNEENNVGFIKGKRNATMGYGIKVCCQFDLRESRPICPLFDDGKEVKHSTTQQMDR